MNYSSPEAAYLDIETSWSGDVTIVGVYRPGLDTWQGVGPAISPSDVLERLEGARALFTYNGSRFDLPVLRRRIGLDLKNLTHVDLMHGCWKKGLKGGLKNVERTLGIARETEGVDGLQAMRLWDRYARAGDREALSLLLRYNREDVENLETLALKLERLP